MKSLTMLAILGLAALAVSCARAPGPAPTAAAPVPVVGIHLLGYTSDAALQELAAALPALAAQGVNLIVLEVDYSFEFTSHPELRAQGPRITPAGAAALAAVCRQHGIRLVPQFQSLGHQSWAQHTGPLLTVYPELDITSGAFPNNEGIYCREWDPTNPRVNQIVLPLIDEIVDAFGADAVHVGMDEVFLLGSPQSPTTKGMDPAVLFAQVVNEFHDHFVKGRGLELFMWADRFLDANEHGYGTWEASDTGTAGAIDLVPTDIVLCDWHYEPMRAYTSVDLFTRKGFRVLPSSWRNVAGVQALVKYSHALQHPKMLGHLFTTWRRVEPAELVAYEPLVAGMATVRGGRFFDVAFDLQSVSPAGVLEVALSASDADLAIHYTTDGTAPTTRSPRYGRAVRLDRSATVRALAARGDVVVSDVTAQDFVVHLATGRPLRLAVPPSPKYPPRGGTEVLVNGVLGSDSYADGQWVGLEGPDLEATLDLGGLTPVTSVVVTSLNAPGSWVFPGARLEVAGSQDGSRFVPLGAAEVGPTEGRRVPLAVRLPPASVRALRVTVRNRMIPDGHEGAGQPEWLFVDEIVVR